MDDIPDLNLTRMIWVHGEGHELLQRHAILGIDLKQGRGDGSKFEALLHDLRRHEEGGRNLCIALTLVAQRHKRAELVERVQGDPLHVFRKGIVLGEDRGPRIPHDAGNGRSLRQTLLLHQQGQCLEAAATGRDLELAGCGAIVSKLTVPEVDDLFEIRAVLVGLAARRLARSAPSKDLTQIEKRIEELQSLTTQDDQDVKRYVTISQELSFLLCAGTESEQLTSIVYSLFHQTIR